jgi:tRNA threonylcarbamoyladenosine biosynthesis protein TsaE
MTDKPSAAAMALRAWTTSTEEETRTLGRRLAAELADDAVLLLEGEMGTGKTVFVQGLAAGLGIEEQAVQSPTYTLVHEHRGRSKRLFHLDLYRLEGKDFDASGLGELWEERAIKVVEWAERLPAEYRSGRRFVFELCDGECRRIEEWEVAAMRGVRG